jgi:hypothetical protein
MYNTATYAMVGFRGYVFGERNGVHGTITAAGGYFDGSFYDGVGVMMVGSIGYDRVDLCFTGFPDLGSKTDENKDPEKSSSGVVAAFLKIRVMEF